METFDTQARKDKDRIITILLDMTEKLKTEVEVLRWINEKEDKGSANELGTE